VTSGHSTARKPGILALAAMTAGVALGAERPPTPVTVVPEVDLDRYAGRWYEIARLPNRFQQDCACCVTATYTVRGDGRLTVVNECRTADGRPKSAEGEAKLAAKAGPSSKLKVRFAPRFLSFLGVVWGDYWILDLDEDYSHALVGSPDRKYLWVLSRELAMAEETYDGMLGKAGAMGFDIGRVQKTAQEAATPSER
jgi:apolipoprotein D and lipocalin family protein